MRGLFGFFRGKKKKQIDISGFVRKEPSGLGYSSISVQIGARGFPYIGKIAMVWAQKLKKDLSEAQEILKKEETEVAGISKIIEELWKLEQEKLKLYRYLMLMAKKPANLPKAIKVIETLDKLIQKQIVLIKHLAKEEGSEKHTLEKERALLKQLKGLLEKYIQQM